MEIKEIQAAASTRTMQKKEGVARSNVVDQLSISSESEKKAAWVEMLKEMPDVRPEKIAAAMQTTPSSLELAHSITESYS